MKKSSKFDWLTLLVILAICLFGFLRGIGNARETRAERVDSFIAGYLAGYDEGDRDAYDDANASLLATLSEYYDAGYIDADTHDVFIDLIGDSHIESWRSHGNSILNPIDDSDAVSAIGYWEDGKLLLVEYESNGYLYGYKEVPKRVYSEFLEAESKGTYVNEVVKPKYDYERIE